MQLSYILQAVDSVKTSSRNQQLLLSHRLAERPNPGGVSFNCLFRWRWSWFLWGLLCKSTVGPRQSWAAQEVRLHFQNKRGNEDDVNFFVPGVCFLLWKAWLDVDVCSCYTGLCGDSGAMIDRAPCGDWKLLTECLARRWVRTRLFSQTFLTGFRRQLSGLLLILNITHTYCFYYYSVYGTLILLYLLWVYLLTYSGLFLPESP